LTGEVRVYTVPRMNNANSTQPFVIYNLDGVVLGFVEHYTGERAANKAEFELRIECVLWDAWENATPANQKKAARLGAIT
jgi:hypothetical protein